MKTASEIRNTFLEYFRSQGHEIVPSAPVVVKDDPTLMFTNAGMNQFKDVFLGVRPRTHARIADTQKCLRVSGKHNDLEEVGHDTYHHTLFEMLGNWSFGDYYKEEAISWAWELLTKRYQIPVDRIYVTVFGGDSSDNLPADTDAEAIWSRFLPADRILRFTKNDNFWEMGDTGPCGPCSEIHVDVRPDSERISQPGRELVNTGNPRVIEIWNLVFMEFNRQADASLIPLPTRSVDTGMGFERLCMVLQGVESTYDTDLFKPIKDFLEDHCGSQYGRSEQESIAMRVIMDHIRAITFTIADGQLPSNTGAGYVIRRILRRASRYGFRYLNQRSPFLFRLVPVMADIYAHIFPNVKSQQALISRIIEEEERQFLSKLDRGSRMFEEYISHRSKAGEKCVEGAFAFELYDTYGFPFDLTGIMARENGWNVDEEGFNRQLQAQKERSRAASEVKTGDWVECISNAAPTTFLGYDHSEAPARVVRYRKVKAAKGELVQIVLDQTPFYAESGGQIGDSGWLVSANERIQVLDTRKENDLIIHICPNAPENPDAEYIASIDVSRRAKIRANHSATHLLHAALRTVLGAHVEQKGSLVSDEVLRFDFSHFTKVSEQELQSIEAIVNEKIAEFISLDERRSVPIEEAKMLGAMALFGEKYGDHVRVITFDPSFSRELCGGTHVSNTGEIRLFRIVSEGSVAAGIRRIEALTGEAAIHYLRSQEEILEKIKQLLKGTQQPLKAIEELLIERDQLNKELQEIRASQLMDIRDALRSKVQEINDLNVIIEQVDVAQPEDLRTLSFELKKAMENAVIILGANIKGKPQLSVMLADEVVADRNLNASTLVRELAREIQGGGGGQPFFATAGGKDPEGIVRALNKAITLI